MEALIMAGGKGTRMGRCGVEKPMIEVGGTYTVERVVKALQNAETVDRILVSVSPNTPDTETYMHSLGVETIRTSGEDYVDDLHKAFSALDGDYVLCLPSDIPLIRPYSIDAFVRYFDRNKNDSMSAIIKERIVVESGIRPSFPFTLEGEKWVLTGMNIMNRKKLLDGVVLDCSYFETDWVDLAINMNTQHELDLARMYFSDQ